MASKGLVWEYTMTMDHERQADRAPWDILLGEGKAAHSGGGDTIY